jgi:hypothetical protein
MLVLLGFYTWMSPPSRLCSSLSSHHRAVYCQQCIQAFVRLNRHGMHVSTYSKSASSQEAQPACADQDITISHHNPSVTTVFAERTLYQYIFKLKAL